MRLLSCFCLVVLTFFLSNSVFSQVPNDDCFGAINLGTMPQPEPCGNGQDNGEGVLQTYNLDNIGSIAENPYSTIVSCWDGADMATPAADVWFSFVASGPELDVTITGAITPSMGLFEGDCNGLVPRGCNNGNAMETYSPLNPGDTYYLQISGQDVNDQGTFTLELYNYYACNGCVQGATIGITPNPANGYYLPGTNVQYCFTVDDYVQQSTNWFHGVAPSFGPGWDMATLQPGATPTSLGGGTWMWTDNVTSTATGLNIPEFGWYMDLDGDGDPGNNFGDTDDWANGANIGPFPPLCWTVTTQQCPAGVSTMDLSVSLNTLADGEIGAWSSIACQNDQDFLIPAMLLCCEPPIMTSTPESCPGMLDGTATATPVGSVNPWTYSWEDGTGSNIQTDNNLNGPSTVSGLGPGTYYVTVTDANGCQTTNNFVTVGSGSSASTSINAAGPFCTPDPSSNLSATSGPGTWAGNGITDVNNGTFDPATAGSGTHIITYTLSGGCPASDTEQIIVNSSFDATITPAGPYCDSDPATNLSAADAGGTWTGTGITNATLGIFDPAAAGVGTHIITYSIAGSCGDSDTEQFVVNSVADATITPSAFCPGDPAANLTAAMGGGTWTGPGITDAVNGTFDPTTAGTGTHNITYSITGGCGDTDTENVVVDNPLDATITQPAALCPGDAPITLVGASGSGTWSGTGITDVNNGTFDPSVAGTGTHNITYSIPGACGDTDTEDVIVNGLVDPTINPAGPFCDSDATTALTAASGGGTWTGTGITNASSGFFDPSVAGPGTHTVSYVVSGSCGDSDTEDIIVAGVQITNSAFTNVSCAGALDGSITITAPSATNFTIDDGSTTSTQTNGNFTGLAGGTYTITVMNTAVSPACTDQTVIVVNEPSPLTMNFASFNVTCNGVCDGSAIVIPAGSNSPYSYLWSTGQTNASLLSLCAGSFGLTVTDAGGCNIDTAFVISEPSAFTVTTSTTNSNCGFSDGFMEVTTVTGASPGAAGYTFLWTPGNFTTQQVNNVLSGQYDVLITDTAGCNTTVTVNVGNNPGPTSNTSNTSTLCFGSCDGTATINGSGGTGAGTYLFNWSDSQTTQTAFGLCTGSYNVTLTDGNGCTSVQNVSVPQPTEVLVTVNQDSLVCIGGSFNLNAIASGGTGSGYNYTWDHGGVGPNPGTVNPSFPNCYTVTATDANGCASQPATTCVQLHPQLNLSALADQTICPGSNVTLSSNATGGIGTPYTYSWTNDFGAVGNTSIITDNPVGTNPSVVTYMVIASDACETPDDTAYVFVDFHVMPVADFSVDIPGGCSPHTATLTSLSSNAFACLWTFGDGSFDQGCVDVTHTWTAVGSYDIQLSVISPEGCQDDLIRQAYISVYPSPVADFTFGPQPTTVMETEITFIDMSLGQGIVTWDWNFFSNQDDDDLIGSSTTQHPVFDFSSEDYPFNLSSNSANPYNYFSQDTGIYPVTLEVTTANGCTHDTIQYVQVDGLFYVNVPNAFTPNGDGLNDEFFPKGMGIDPYNNYHFYIFNRWGDLLWESENLNEGWDGTARALGGTDKVQEGVYVWRLEVQEMTKTPKVHTLVGHVVLLR